VYSVHENAFSLPSQNITSISFYIMFSFPLKKLQFFFVNFRINFIFYHNIFLFSSTELELQSYTESDFFIKESRDMITIVQSMIIAGNCYFDALFFHIFCSTYVIETLALDLDISTCSISLTFYGQ
jgi:hypothetical protein